MQIVVGIASVGRPEILGAMLDQLASQRRRPDAIIVSLSEESDLAECERFRRAGVTILCGRRGLTRQRNALLAAARQADLLAFFDDDFLPCDDYLAEAEALFAGRPDIALATGEVLVDGILGEGVSLAAARAIMDEAGKPPQTGDLVRDVYNGYGCNMVVALAPVSAQNLSFDERLPLYGWLEDVDFSRRLAECGAIIHSRSLRGVHLGVKQGRQSGRRLGYSQIANPLYLVAKRTMSSERAVWQICRNIGMNALKSLNPEPHVDRRGRLAGNVSGLLDLLRFRLDPEKVLRM